MADGQRDYTAMDLALAVRRLDLMMSQMHLEMSERLGLSAAELWLWRICLSTGRWGRPT